jgi:KipI family sensor histidine kinase inhibitor
MALEAEPFGASALLIWCQPDQVVAVAERARVRWPLARDVVPAAESVLVDGIADLGEAVDEVLGWSVGSVALTSPRLVQIDTVYDGPDLADVAEMWGIAIEDVIEIHTSALHQVAFCGFAPGFAYCTGIPRPVPRRASPRARVEPGSVALADLYTGIYPTASPGGWQLIGRTEAPLWDLARDEPALLTPGTQVRFVPL